MLQMLQMEACSSYDRKRLLFSKHLHESLEDANSDILIRQQTLSTQMQRTLSRPHTSRARHTFQRYAVRVVPIRTSRESAKISKFMRMHIAMRPLRRVQHAWLQGVFLQGDKAINASRTENQKIHREKKTACYSYN